MALAAASTLLIVPACSDDAAEQTGPSSSADATTDGPATSEPVMTTTTPTTTGDTTTSDTTTTAPTASTSPGTIVAPTSVQVDTTGPPDQRPIAAVVAVGAGGCRVATAIGELRNADLVIPDDVGAEVGDLILGSGTLTDGAMPGGCTGVSETLTFETIDLVRSMDEQAEPDVADLLAVEFDHPWECGRGFAMSDQQQRWAIGIEPVAGNVTESRGTVITLPSEQFGVSVLYGVDLAAGNCDTGREPFARSPLWLAIWPVTSGSFQYPEATIICDGSSVSTELVDAVVETPDGPVELPPIEMTNPAFACGPGWDD